SSSHSSAVLPALPSFPTRRSSDLPRIGEPKVPEPRDLEYEAYGRLLNVPGIDPYDEEIGHVHLWHLLDDAHALQRFLSSSIETRSEEHTSELQSREKLVCRLLLEQ